MELERDAYSSVKSSWNYAVNSWVFSEIQTKRENGCVSIISCGCKPINHCSAMGKSHFCLGFYICEKGTVTLFMVILPSMPRTVGCVLQQGCCYKPKIDGHSIQRGWICSEISLFPFSKLQIPKAYCLRCFPGGVAWKELFSGMRLVHRPEHPVIVCVPGGRHKSWADIWEAWEACITCILQRQLLFSIRMK